MPAGQVRDGGLSISLSSPYSLRLPLLHPRWSILFLHFFQFKMGENVLFFYGLMPGNNLFTCPCRTLIQQQEPSWHPRCYIASFMAVQTQSPGKKTCSPSNRPCCMAIGATACGMQTTRVLYRSHPWTLQEHPYWGHLSLALRTGTFIDLISSKGATIPARKFRCALCERQIVAQVQHVSMKVNLNPRDAFGIC